MLHQNVLSQIKRIQLSCFLPLNIISLVVLSLILFFTNINIYAAQVSLTWGTNSESDLAGYKIYYGNSSGSYDSNIDVGNQTSYTVTGLVEGETNYFALAAYDMSGNESSYSSEVVYNVPDNTLPSTPTNLQAAVVSTSQVDLAWNASTDNIGITGYRIYRDSTQIATTSNTTYQDTGLSSSTTYSYTVTAYDAAGNESGQSSTSSATTLSLPVNNPPVLSSIGNKSVNEGQALSFTISATDPDGDTLNYTASNLPYGTIFNESTRTFSWTPTYSQAGTYSNITFQVSDGTDIDSESITITANNVNRTPALNPITDITVNEGVLITLNPTATDPDGDTLTYTYSGWMTSAIYTTNYTDAGIHTVTVTVSDGTLSDSQNVSVTVNNVNQAPVLDTISDITVSDGVTITINPTATDQDEDTLTYTYTGWMTSSSYTTNSNDVGTHTVTVTVSDGTLTDSQAVTVIVLNSNSEPVLDPIADITVNEGATITLSPTATDPDEDALTYTYSGWMSSVSYTTTYDDAGIHTVTVTVSDDSLSDSQVVTITVVEKDKEPLEISNLTVASGETYEIVKNGLQNGAVVYIDRNYAYSTVPTWLQDTTYIKTANNDKRSSAASFLTFDANQDVIVYVAYDDRITTKPSWLESFTDTGDDLIVNGENHSIFTNNYLTGTITLGGNEGVSNSSMYTVTIVGQGNQGNNVDTIQPSTPTNLQASAVSKTKMNLSWNASTDNVGVTGYRIYRDEIQVADVSSTTYQDTGLSKNTTYVYTISAYDAAGNESSQSTPLASNTKSPGRPTGMRIVGT